MDSTPSIILRSEAFRFILVGLPDWATIEHRIQTVQNLLDVAGFDAKATCAPDFHQLWVTPCTGTEGKEATKWLEKISLGIMDVVKPEDRWKWVPDDALKLVSEEIHWQREAHGLNTPKG